MNKTVKATNMTVTATAEEGLLISEVKKGTTEDAWDDEAKADQSSIKSVLYPTSTADGTNWYVAYSTKSNDAAAATAAGTKSDNLVDQTYNTLASSSLKVVSGLSNSSDAAVDAAKFSTYGKSESDDAGYYVVYTYYLKSSNDAVTLGTASGNRDLKIKSVTCIKTNVGSNGAAADNLQPAIRVGIKVGESFYIYAPGSSATSTYYVNATTACTPKTSTTETSISGDVTTLPATSSESTTQVDVYVWYEGEDAACKSDNALATTLDNYTITVNFGLDTVS